MIFYRHPVNPIFGFCDCDQGVRSEYPCTDHPVRKMVYIPSERKCAAIFSQVLKTFKGIQLRVSELLHFNYFLISKF